ncbi:hypothetical protein PVAP13_4NG251244 [Panicum virgatum]|uniref:Uncharacterized protein n=1 Tax=Panicum virgatum TaxID=38727 RepID=A0A8T0TEA1_PANVG|nr:hypothetical protein PVAP13_4NG251244 [Panicum virgatum]
MGSRGRRDPPAPALRRDGEEAAAEAFPPATAAQASRRRRFPIAASRLRRCFPVAGACLAQLPHPRLHRSAASSSSVEIHETTAPRLVGPSDPQVLLPCRCLDPPPPETMSHHRPETEGRGGAVGRWRGREQGRRRRSPLGEEAARARGAEEAARARGADEMGELKEMRFTPNYWSKFLCYYTTSNQTDPGLQQRRSARGVLSHRPQPTAPAGAPPSPSPRGPPLWNLRPASASPAQAQRSAALATPFAGTLSHRAARPAPSQAQRSAALATPFAGTLSHRAARPAPSLCLILASHVGIPLSVPWRCQRL